MKTFKMKKILALLMVLTMILGMGGMNVRAAETDTNVSVDIISKNVYYGETLNIMFAVEAANVPDGGDVQLVLTKNGQKVNTVETMKEVNGTSAYVFMAEKGVAAQSMNDIYTAKAQIIVGGDVVAESDTCTYSVLEYFYERFYVSSSSEQQKDLYKKMLAYAGAAEVVLKNSTAIADSVYVHTTNGIVEGEKVSGVYASAEVNQKIAGVTTDITIGKGYECAWEITEYDAEGNVVKEDKIAATELANYAVAASTKAVILTAYAKETGFVEPEWRLVTDASEITAGAQIVIVAVDADKAMSTTQNKNNRGTAAVTKNTQDNTITFGDDVQIINVEAGNKAGTLAFNVGDGYLYAASSSSNNMKTDAKLSDNASWIITVKDGVATIKAQGTYERNTILYQTSGLVSCYKGTSASVKEVCIYMYK